MLVSSYKRVAAVHAEARPLGEPIELATTAHSDFSSTLECRAARVSVQESLRCEVERTFHDVNTIFIRQLWLHPLNVSQVARRTRPSNGNFGALRDFKHFTIGGKFWWLKRLLSGTVWQILAIRGRHKLIRLEHIFSKHSPRPSQKVRKRGRLSARNAPIFVAPHSQNRVRIS
jgi:hypothetical protein